MGSAIGAFVLGLYGWYMYAQGKKNGFLLGLETGPATTLVMAVMQSKITKSQAKDILPSLNDDVFDAIKEALSEVNANIRA